MTYEKSAALPFGHVTIRSDGISITSVTYGTGETTETCPVIEQCIAQLTDYAAGKRKVFDFPLAPAGTEFQRSVWRALEEIPYGETRTYAQIAAAVGKPKATRAVGGACNKNPILMIIPCHRVIGKNGSLTGFAPGLDLKQTLLNLETQYK